MAEFDGELRVRYTAATQPGEVTVVSTEEREQAEAARDQAQIARDAAIAAQVAAEAALGTFTAPGDDVIASLVGSDSATRAALDDGYLRQGDLVVDIRSASPAVDLTGATDSSAALQTLIDGLPAGAMLLIPANAVIRMDSAVTLARAIHIDGRGATFDVKGTSSGFLIPAAASGSSFRNMRLQGANPITYATTSKAFHVTGIPAAWVEGLRFFNVSCDGFGYGGFFGSHISDAVFTDCTVTNSVYCGFQFLSALNVTLWNPTIDTLEGLLVAGGQIQSYPVAWTRDSLQDIIDYPNSTNCTIWGGLIQNTTWEGVDTHGGVNIRTFGMTILGCMYPIAYVPCPDPSNNDTWAPLSAVAAFNYIDSGVTDGSKGAGIRLVGATSATDQRVAAASGRIFGNTIIGHGGGNDLNTVGAAIQVYETDGVFISDNELIEPSPFGIAAWYGNTNLTIGANYVRDVWSNTFAAPAAVAIRSSRNTVSLGAVRLVAGTKTATNKNSRGLYISSAVNNTVALTGGEDFSIATTPYSVPPNGLVRSQAGGVEVGASTAVPAANVWSRGAQWWKTSAAASASPGWVCTTAGGGYTSTWAATTAVTAGLWVRTSTGKVMECLVAGTTSGTQPDPTVLGSTVTDGTVTWVYRSATSAVFTPMASLSA